MTNTTASTPAPTTQALVFSLIRSGLLLASGLGLYHGAEVPDATLSLVASTALALGTGAWSIVDKITTARRQHSIAVASAVTGRPVIPPGV